MVTPNPPLYPSLITTFDGFRRRSVYICMSCLFSDRDFFRTTPFTSRNRDLRNALYFCHDHLCLVHTKNAASRNFFPALRGTRACKPFLGWSQIVSDNEVWSGQSWPFWADLFRATPFTSRKRDLWNALASSFPVEILIIAVVFSYWPTR